MNHFVDNLQMLYSQSDFFYVGITKQFWNVNDRRKYMELMII